MLASKLIEQLQDLIDAEGDQEVYYLENDSHDGVRIDYCEITEDDEGQEMIALSSGE